MWLVATSFVIVVFAAASLWLSRTRKLDTKSWLASAVLVLWVVGVGIKLHLDQAQTAPSPTASLGSIAWPGAGTAQPNVAASTAPQVAPVDSLVTGLELRLAEQPDDADGWALLAQSYAFVGDFEAAESALGRAVMLGVDERMLRERVDVAKRQPHPAIPGAAIGGE